LLQRNEMGIWYFRSSRMEISSKADKRGSNGNRKTTSEPLINTDFSGGIPQYAHANCTGKL